jgi:hypothetical protein
MVDKEYYNDILLENKEYLELVEKYKTKDLSLIAQLIIKETDVNDRGCIANIARI